MVTYLDYHVLNFMGGYNIRLDKDGLTNIPCGWIPEERLKEYLNFYLDIDNNDVYIRFADMDTFMEVPKNRGEVRP